MNRGPNPSRAWVEDGASTQLRRKNELPIAKRVRSASDRLANGNENALRPFANTVVAPPVRSPRGSATSSARRCAPATPQSAIASTTARIVCPDTTGLNPTRPG